MNSLRVEFVFGGFLDASWLMGVRTIYRSMKVKISELNFYQKNNQRPDVYVMATGRISTRVYLFFLALSITNLIIFTSLQTDIHRITIDHPSAKIFEKLHQKYSSTLQCPCTQMAINYGSFISLSPRYHPVCSSLYISNEWINSIPGIENIDFHYQHDDFHLVGQPFFSTISVLCSTAQSTLDAAWFIFNHSTLITENAISKDELIIRTNTIFEQFEINTIKEFKRLFSLIRLHTKTMLSAKRTNVEFYTRQSVDDLQVIFSHSS